MRDPLHVEDEAILSGDVVVLTGVSLTCDQLSLSINTNTP